MNCPQCHQPMTQVGRFWICGEHGQHGSDPIAPVPVPPRSAQFDRLPSVLAIPLGEYAHETHPVMRLHRLCDAVEILTRFSFIVELGELRIRLGDNPFPERLARALRDKIERPTLGKWKELLQATAEGLAHTDPLVVPDLREFVLGELIPGLERGLLSPKGKKGSDEPGLIDLRNNLVHGGAMTQAEAIRQLEIWEPWLDELVGRLDFLADADLCYLIDGAARRLVGPDPAVGDELPLSADFRVALGSSDRHVVLIYRERWVDLWPLCDYGRAERPSRHGPLRAQADSPMVYIRAERYHHLLYAALGADLPHFENRGSDVLGRFQALFTFKDRTRPEQGEANDFEDDLRLDSASLVGRVGEIEQAVDLLKRTQSGVLWLTGKGGIGKSYFTARLAMDGRLISDPKKLFRIAWRFQASDQGRCNRIAFFRHAVARLEGWLHGKQGFVATHDLGPLFAQLQGLLDEVAAREAGPHPNARAPRVLFVLDGLDEIARSDPDFASVPSALSKKNVVWLCSGRPEGVLPERFAPDLCTPVFPSGLPTMSDDDIRRMLLQASDKLKYDILGLDREQVIPDAKTVVSNPAVKAVISRAEGLPLYVRFVVQDLLSDEFTVHSLDLLPPSLNGYYDELLERLGIGDLQPILTPLVTTIAWARAPLDEATLHLLMVRRGFTDDTEEGLALVRKGLDVVQAMLRPAPIAGTDRLGFEPYHPTLREHIRADHSGKIRFQNKEARKQLCALIGDWGQLPAGHPGRLYVFRHGPQHLLEEGWLGPLYALGRDEAFLRSQEQELPNEPQLPLVTLQAGLTAAGGEGDGDSMAEFLLRHASRALARRTSSPLLALRAGNLDGALRLADLSGIEHAALYRLLLVWELLDTGDGDQARRLLRELATMKLSDLTDWKRGYGAFLIAKAVLADPSLIEELVDKLLDDDGMLDLCIHCCAEGRFAEALAVLPRIKGREISDRAAQEISMAQARSGDISGAEATLLNVKNNGPLRKLKKVMAQKFAEDGDIRGAIKVACGFEAKAERSSVFLSIIRVFLDAKRGSEVVREIRRIKDPRIQSQGFHAMVVMQLASGDIELAIKSAYSIRQASYEEEAKHAIAVAHAKRGNQDRASFLLQGINQDYRRAQAESAVALAMAEAGMQNHAFTFFGEAIQRSLRIGDKKSQAKLLGIIGADQLKAGFADEAAGTFKLTAKAAREAKSSWCLLETFGYMARVNSLAGKIDEAMGWARQIRQREPHLNMMIGIVAAAVEQGLLAKAMEIANKYKGGLRDKMLGGLAESLMAADSPEKALEVASGIWSKTEQLNTILLIVMGLVRGGNSSQAREIIASSLFERWLSGDAVLWQCRVLTTIALALNSSRFKEEAIKNFNTGVENTKHLRIDTIRIREMVKAQIAASQAGLIEESDALANVTIELNRIENVGYRETRLAEAAIAFARSGQISSATILCGKGEDLTNRSKVLSSIALEYMSKGEKEKARSTFEDAFRAASEIKGAAIRAWILELVAIDRGTAGFFDDGRETLEAVKSYLPRIDDISTRKKSLGGIERVDRFIANMEALTIATLAGGRFEAIPIPAAPEPLPEGEAPIENRPEISDVELVGDRGSRIEALLAFTANRIANPEQLRNLLKHTKDMLLRIKVLKDWNESILRLASLQVEAGLIDEAFELIDHVTDENSQAALIQVVASGCALAGRGSLAVQLSERILVNRRAHLPSIAASLAEARDIENFRKMLVPCAYTFDAALQLCGLLAGLYPDAASKIAKRVVSLETE